MALAVADRFEILDLAARYNHAVDGGDAAAVAALFVEDGVLDADATGPIRGRDAIAAYIASRPDGWQRRRHWNNSPVIEGDGDEATLALYLAVVSWRETIVPRLVGRYRDELRRVDGAWRFVRRRIDVDANPGG